MSVADAWTVSIWQKVLVKTAARMSVVVCRVGGENDANSTSDSGTRSGFFCPVWDH